MNITELFQVESKILGECAIAERLRRIPDVRLHETLYNTPLIYGPDGAREIMTGIYREYLSVAQAASLPLLLTAPTWRLDHERVKLAGVPATINTDAVAFLQQVKADFDSHQTVCVGALTGPQNDCYRADLAPEEGAAQAFHSQQIDELAATDADFLLAQTLPAVPEAIGIARAMAAAGKPYIISFCTGVDGDILDGTPLPEAMRMIDEVSTPPLGYFVNCTHPAFLLKGYEGQVLDRLIGIQANASSKNVLELDGSGKTEADSVDTWARDMLRLHVEHGVKALGGCCGTTTQHLEALTAEI